MKISEILKSQGVFSKEIKQRFGNGQIKVNFEVSKDENLDIVTNEEKPKAVDLGDFLFDLLKENPTWYNQLHIFGLEALVAGEINSALSRHLKKYKILHYSKKDAVVLEVNKN